jgi:outer membrane protein assembly factor BamE (lipoprotein component of BamABCDE complex)
MRKAMAVLVMSLALNGCATSHYTSGKDFPSEKVTSIVKGKTTTTELKALFGDPFTKSPVNDTDEKWVYTYANGSAHAQSYIVTMKVTTTGTQKTLEVLIRNGTVINFTFNEGQNPYNSTTN